MEPPTFPRSRRAARDCRSSPKWESQRSAKNQSTRPLVSSISDPPFRFMNGTTPSPALEACRPGLQIVTEVGVEKIREKSKHQTARLIELADHHGWQVNTPRDPEQRGGTVSIDMPNSQAVSRELLAREFLVDWRPKAGVRFSPHFYNTDEEVDAALAAVATILKERSVTA